MKRKKWYYNQFGFVFMDWNIDKWLKVKDRFLQFVSSAYDQAFFGIKIKSKHRHRRSIRYTDTMVLLENIDGYRFTREAKVIGRIKHRKCLYTPKRCVFKEETYD